LSATPQLDLAFERHAAAGTRLARRIVRYPYVVTNTFRIDAAPAHMVSVILQSASGAILAEDRLRLRIAAGPGAAVHVMTPAATAVHRMPDGAMAEERIDLLVGAGALLEFMPEPRILFADAALAQELRLCVDVEGIAVVADGFLTHDPQGRKAPFRRLRSTIEIARPDDTVLAVDRFDIDGRGQLLRAAQFGCHGIVIVVGRFTRDDLAAIGAAAGAAVAALGGLYAATSALPSECGISLRLACSSGAVLRQATNAAWAAIRCHLTGSPPARRRI
jgi:urease accessory protein